MKVLQKQIWHLIILGLLLTGLFFITSGKPTITDGEFSGIETRSWLLLAILSPVVHQLYVLIAWRLELYYKSISKRFGPKGFSLYKKGFAILILSRLVTITLLALSNKHSASINPTIAYFVAGVFILPTVYLFYSVAKYFGMDRAFGIDHFEPEKTKEIPFVKQGVFKYSPNSMYVFGFLALWIPGLIFQSEAALLVALFNHLYIWVHYYFTELPDMKVIYGDGN